MTLASTLIEHRSIVILLRLKLASLSDDPPWPPIPPTKLPVTSPPRPPSLPSPIPSPPRPETAVTVTLPPVPPGAPWPPRPATPPKPIAALKLLLVSPTWAIASIVAPVIVRKLLLKVPNVEARPPTPPLPMVTVADALPLRAPVPPSIPEPAGETRISESPKSPPSPPRPPTPPIPPIAPIPTPILAEKLTKSF